MSSGFQSKSGHNRTKVDKIGQHWTTLDKIGQKGIKLDKSGYKGHIGSSTFRLGWICSGLARSLPRSSSLSAMALFLRPQLPRFLKLTRRKWLNSSIIIRQLPLLLFTWLWKGLDSRGSLCSGCSLSLKLTHRITSACAGVIMLQLVY